MKETATKLYQPMDGTECSNDHGQPTRELSQAKAVLLGEVGAGKTSFLNALRYGQAHLAPDGPRGRTVGIEVHAVELSEDVMLWFYDFGGHETYRFSQQLFLSEKAVYILTVDISSPSGGHLKILAYWYAVLSSRLRSPVLCLLATHTDNCTEDEVNQRCGDLLKSLMDLEQTEVNRIQAHFEQVEAAIERSETGEAHPVMDFAARSLSQPLQRILDLLRHRPQICQNVLRVSSKTLEGVHEACGILLDVIKCNSERFPHESIPTSWLALGDDLTSLRMQMPFLQWGEFELLAQKHGVPPRDLKRVLDYLQTSGVVLHYEDHKKESQLRDLVFNNANLLLAIFGLIFNHNYFSDEARYVWYDKSMLRLEPTDLEILRRNLRRHALIGEQLLRCFWASLGLDEEVFQAVLSLLEKFDLCYEVSVLESKHLPEGRHFRFPYLLREHIPEEAWYAWPDVIPDNLEEHQLLLSLETPRVPVGFMEKISVRINPYLDLRADWRSGMVAFCSDGQDLVKMEIFHQGDNTAVAVRARVRHTRRHMARHLLLLFVAVINKILLRQYPGVLGYWYVVCAHCIEVSYHKDIVDYKEHHSEFHVDDPKKVIAEIQDGHIPRDPQSKIKIKKEHSNSHDGVNGDHTGVHRPDNSLNNSELEDSGTGPLRLGIFPADNLVFASEDVSNESMMISCQNCREGKFLRPGQVFPSASETPEGYTGQMGSPERKSLKLAVPRMVKEVDARQLLTPLLKRGVLSLRQAEDVTIQSSNRERMQKLLKFLVTRGHGGFLALCQALRSPEVNIGDLAQTLEFSAQNIADAVPTSTKPTQSMDAVSVDSPRVAAAFYGWPGGS